MKPEIHPSNYRPVVFRDVGAEESWICSSTVETEKEIEWEDGKTYPLYDLPISAYSHPFFTGKQRIMDVEGRVDKFKKKYASKKK